MRDRPWAVGGLCRVTFKIGELVTTKRLRSKFTFWGSGAWPNRERPSDLDIEEGKRWVLDNLRAQMARHGFEAPEFTVIDEGQGETDVR